eukprot:TRINITY_DN7163_c0_g2_i1.p1 TRINITY_DN7163_c0_g2~~TRINITY_DN7163_c0_g2_i1.p1  ORF type:complete len:369 (-),score=87.58 TRINITY_DN7163_c0_g2_i1:51-1157(-)
MALKPLVSMFARRRSAASVPLGAALRWAGAVSPAASSRHRQRSFCSGAAAGTGTAAGSGAATASDKQREYWDIDGTLSDAKVKFKFTEEDLARFQKERQEFRDDPRLQPDALPRFEGAEEELDALFKLKGLAGALRLGDLVTPPLKELLEERCDPSQAALMRHFELPPFEHELGYALGKPLHNHAIPKDGAYFRVRLQAYWISLHIWFLHSKQYMVQENEGLFGSAICALITRKLFEWQWDNMRLVFQNEDVPVMSIKDELQDLQEYIFGFCVAIDDAFKDEVPKGQGTAQAATLAEAALPEGCHGLGPRVKHVLWANVYSGGVPHDSPCIHELTVYVLRQRAFVESLTRSAFFKAQFNWAELSPPSR